MNDREIRYNREFLQWYEIKNKNTKYKPDFHIYPCLGLINDPNCIFYYNNNLYCFFQHHPANTLHGLKTMSLAKTNNFINFDYSYMVNKPDQDFDSHGVYSGSSILLNKKIISFYTGNKRDANWNRTSSLVKCEFDLQTNKFINKKALINNHQFWNYTEHFRDPYVFVYNNQYFLLLGAQHIDGHGVILMFILDNNLENPQLVKQINLNLNFKMIECPNIIFIEEKAFLIYCPQYKDEISLKNPNINPDVCVYSYVNIQELFNLLEFYYQIQDVKKVDYGLEFYAPQTFKIKNEWCIIGWVGLPTNLNYLEKENNWIGMLSMIKTINIDHSNNTLVFNEMNQYKGAYLNSQNKFVKYFYTDLRDNKKINIYDDNVLLMSIVPNINMIEASLIIERFEDKSYYPYNNVSSIECDVEKNKIEIFIDNSIIEIKVNDKSWYTSRIYFEKRINIKKESIV